MHAQKCPRSSTFWQDGFFLGGENKIVWRAAVLPKSLVYNFCLVTLGGVKCSK
jgi:hypothetical protein